MNAVSPGYCQAMRIPLIEGRDFKDGDAGQFEQIHVAIVNRHFAEHFFPGRSALGKRIGNGGGPGAKLTMEIVGVVGDSLYEGPREGVHRQTFLANWGKSSAACYERTVRPASDASGLMRSALAEQDS